MVIILIINIILLTLLNSFLGLGLGQSWSWQNGCVTNIFVERPRPPKSISCHSKVSGESSTGQVTENSCFLAMTTFWHLASANTGKLLVNWPSIWEAVACRQVGLIQSVCCLLQQELTKYRAGGSTRSVKILLSLECRSSGEQRRRGHQATSLEPGVLSV